MADIFDSIYSKIKLTDEHVLSLGEVVNTTVVNKLNRITSDIDLLPATINGDVKQIVQTNTAKIENLIHFLSGDIETLGKDVANLESNLESLISTGLEDVISKLEIATEKITEYQEKLEELLQNSIDALNQKLDENLEVMRDEFDGVRILLQNSLATIIEYVGILHNAMKEYIKEQTNQIVFEVKKSTDMMIETVKKSTVEIIENSNKNMEEIKGHVTTGFEAMTASLEEMADRLIQTFTSFFAELKLLITEMINPGEAKIKENIMRNLAIMKSLQKEIQIDDSSVYTEFSGDRTVDKW